MKSLGVSLFETNNIWNIFDRNFSISVSHVVIRHTQRPCKTGVGEGGGEEGGGGSKREDGSKLARCLLHNK